MHLLSRLWNALHLPGERADQDIARLRQRQHEQINRLQRLYADHWNELKRESWLYPHRPPHEEESEC